MPAVCCHAADAGRCVTRYCLSDFTTVRHAACCVRTCLAGVCAEDAVDIGPDGDAGALEQRSQNGGAVIAAVALQCGDLPRGRLGYEACRHNNLQASRRWSTTRLHGCWQSMLVL